MAKQTKLRNHCICYLIYRKEFIELQGYTINLDFIQYIMWRADNSPQCAISHYRNTPKTDEKLCKTSNNSVRRQEVVTIFIN